MASHGKSGVIWINASDFSGIANSMSLSIDNDVAEATSFADAAKVFLVGDSTFTFSYEGFFDATDSATGLDTISHAAAITNMGNQNVLFAPLGVADGVEPVYELLCKWTSRPLVVTIGDVTRVSGTFQGHTAAGLSRGYVIMNETVTATPTGTGRLIGATTTPQVTLATYRVTALTGTVTVTNEKSTDDGSGDAYAAVANLASGSIAADSIVQKTDTASAEQWARAVVTAGPTTAAVLVTATNALPLG